ncbi:MAG: hypothetical protein U0M60_16490, partial [Clostridia bacterium]|nr:hypothetical protein [Clostridia bacterium]
MKKFVSTSIAIVMLFMIFGNIFVFANDAMMSAYVDILSVHRENGMIPQYLIYDIGGNELPELIIMNGTCEADKTAYFYTFLDGKVLALSELGAWHAWYKIIPNKKGLFMFSGRETVGKLITIADGTLYVEEGHKYTDNMIDICFYEKTDTSGFGNFNYITSDNATATLYVSGTKKGIEYY